MKRYIKTKKGLTLVEVVAATSIMSILFVSLLYLFTDSSKNVGMTRERTDMMMFAQDVMEELCNVNGYNGLIGVANGVEHVMLPQEKTNVNALYAPNYDVRWKVESITPDGGATPLLKVTVHVKKIQETNYSTGVVLATCLSNR